MNDDPIYVTRPYLPPLEELMPLLAQIWDSRILTNSGPFHRQFETALANHLGVDHLALFANGTLALVTALQGLRIGGEVITTPYSFVATAHSLLWNGIRPVFVDVEPDTLNLDPARIEAAITPQTTAVLGVHCYGNPCDVRAIQQIADNYNLKVIYDAAHAFGVEDEEGSILRHGDLSVLSFHATKVFTTCEGGAIVCPTARIKLHIDHLKNFGFVNETTVVAVGINGKMNEIQAALGLLQIRHIGAALESRRAIDGRYRELLSGVPGIRCLERPTLRTSNYAYFPVMIEPAYPLERDAVYRRLREAGIFARRYFHPLISEMPMYRGLASAGERNLPNATDAARHILCLPIYPGLSTDRIESIVKIIADSST